MYSIVSLLGNLQPTPEPIMRMFLLQARWTKNMRMYMSELTHIHSGHQKHNLLITRFADFCFCLHELNNLFCPLGRLKIQLNVSLITEFQIVLE